ncbi:hypothetical protein HORIV_40780 [Vreelandella olivaria]|uniref:Uncharacterized protein n=1 Tax=Vreelandella olivaria TaxID=390919 RepID=A0ABN5WXX1_9GAMM|nr:hypothetical protein HORIV_40780 [Halomonas olivaria]
MEDPALRRRNIFAYIDARDLGQMVDCCLKTDGLGYQVFNVANNDLSVDLTNAQVIERFYSDVPTKREMGEFETFTVMRKHAVWSASHRATPGGMSCRSKPTWK